MQQNMYLNEEEIQKEKQRNIRNNTEEKWQEVVHIFREK